jgi:hypothetical protein
MLVRKDGTLDEKMTLSLQRTSLPISLQTVNIMNQLMHCGEDLCQKLKLPVESMMADSDLKLAERAVESLLGVDTANHDVYRAFINDSNNKGFRTFSIPSMISKFSKRKIAASFPFYGCCFLVAFRNCMIHSGPEVTCGYFPEKEAQIIKLARLIRDSTALTNHTRYLYYL